MIYDRGKRKKSNRSPCWCTRAAITLQKAFCFSVFRSSSSSSFRSLYFNSDTSLYHRATLLFSLCDGNLIFSFRAHRRRTLAFRPVNGAAERTAPPRRKKERKTTKMLRACTTKSRRAWPRDAACPSKAASFPPRIDCCSIDHQREPLRFLRGIP